MLKFVASALLLSLAPALPAAAQDSAGIIPEHGNPEADAKAWITLIRNAPERVKTNCWKLGCMVIVNETSGYDVIGFYVDSASPGRSPRWSNNQLPNSLEPAKATLRFKTGGKDMCNLPVRFELRQRDTREKIEVNTTGSFCSTPHEDSLMRIKLQEGGQVFVRGDDEAPPPGETH
ncbi:hypothetical protein HZY97_02350 [Sphingomonas sp. R-74633]|uniref:hypothetical protein n=1 Tax=Sphingomonas sp. R-74633 TaxID=2751188 RepID=UPI0015D176BD|nr:hypothetical protein [Sphingomonas sp. R-74633]NYT39584.1 hypothetical protein [Sphingomonas sp. R-74633]